MKNLDICLNCPSKLKYNELIQQGIFINNKLIKLFPEIQIKGVEENPNFELYTKLMDNFTNYTFMCGKCSEVNENDLTLIEEEIFERISIALFFIKITGNIRKYGEVLRILNNFYPKIKENLNNYYPYPAIQYFYKQKTT